jgi:hypothetical protein
MTPSTFEVLTVIVLSMLLGMFFGIWVLKRSIEYLMVRGVMEIYVKGTKLEVFRMW